MKKILVALVILSLMLCGFGYKGEKHPKRFEMELREVVVNGVAAFIIRDTETGVGYLFVKSGAGAGLTVWEDGAE